MTQQHEFLVEKDAIWADILMQELKANNIPCTAFPVHGAGVVLRAGVQERMKIYVPADLKTQAEKIMEDVFAEDEAQ